MKSVCGTPGAISLMVIFAVAPGAIEPRLQVTVVVPEQLPRVVLSVPVRVAPAGSVSTSVADDAVGPWLVTVSTSENVLPPATLTGAAVVTPRSAPTAPTMTVAVAELLALSGSAVRAVTDAVLAIDPAPVGTAVIAIDSPAFGTEPRSQVTVRSAPAYVHPGALTKSRPAGSMSVS